MSPLFGKLLWWTGRRSKEAELREELQFHLDEETEEGREAGLSPGQAQRAAHLDLGNTTLLQERVRGVWIWTFWERLLQDVRYSARMVAKSPLFSAMAVLSLALGIGANTAIFSFMDSLLLRALPVPEPSSLAILKWHNKALSRVHSGVSLGARTYASVVHGSHGSTDDDPKLGRLAGIFPYPAFEFFEKKNQEQALFTDVFAHYQAQQVNAVVEGQGEVVEAEYVSGNYFRGVGLAPAAGRLIIADDDRVGAPLVAVMSFGYAQNHFGGAANAVGKTVMLNNLLVTVVGVTPPEFFGVNPAVAEDFYLPLHSDTVLEAGTPFGARRERYPDQNLYWIEIMARLRPGVTLGQAQAALLTPFHQWVASTAASDKELVNLPELIIQEGAGGLDELRRQYSQPLFMLMALVGLILAIACANVANLLLARSTARRGEIALRLSIGASRLRIVRQLLTESVMLASLGGALGILVAVWGIHFLTVLLAGGEENFTLHARLNWHVLVVAAALSVLTGVLFGLAPAVQSTRVDVLPALQQIQAGSTRSRMPVSLSHVLLVSQIGLSLLMLVAAGLFLRTMSNLQSVALGFNPENLLLFELNARQAGHKDPEIFSFYDGLLQQFSALPGVRSVSLANTTLVGGGTWSFTVYLDDRPLQHVMFLAVAPRFAGTMQIPMIMGREIDARDRPGSPAVAMVNESFVREHFAGQSPIGRYVAFDKKNPRKYEIVGVTRDLRYGQLQDDLGPIVYVPYNGSPWPIAETTYAMRTVGDPLAFANAVREIVHNADARVPVHRIRTQAAQIDEAMSQEIMFAKLCTAFAVLGLMIASVGLYGSVSYNVARRTSEIGIRMALGAQRETVVWMVLRQVVVLTSVGLAVSLPIAFVSSKVVESFLFKMKPNDPLSMTLAVATLLSAALLAGYLPARRASRIDPMIALRHE
jgi:macrolide transport system ATP-binding/permease protein